jgi:hypothetical protein
MNLSGGTRGLVRFEEQTIALGDWTLCDAMIAALSAGITKEEIETGRYRVASYQHSADAVRTFEDAHGPARGGAWFTLCLWLAQRDEADYAATLAARKETDGGRTSSSRAVGARGAGGVPGRRRVEPDALGADRDADARRGQDDHDGAGVDGARPARPAHRGAGQIALFGDGGAGRGGR